MSISTVPEMRPIPSGGAMACAIDVGKREAPLHAGHAGIGAAQLRLVALVAAQ